MSAPCVAGWKEKGFWALVAGFSGEGAGDKSKLLTGAADSGELLRGARELKPKNELPPGVVSLAGVET